MTSWMSRRVLLSNFGRPALGSWGILGRFTTVTSFSPFVDNGSDRGSLESQSLRNSFITLSRLIHVNYFVFSSVLSFL